MDSITYIFIVLLFLHSLFSPSTSLSTNTNICSTTRYPSFCSSILSPNNSSSIHENTRYSIQQSLSETKQLLSLLDNYHKHQETMPIYATRAIINCKALTTRNIELLSYIYQSLTSTKTLHPSKVQETHTLLSTVVTNHDTCLEGLESVTSPSNMYKTFQAPLTNATMLYSISLKLFVSGYVNDTKPTFWDAGFYQNFKNLPSVNKMVVVDPSGKGDYKTISDAVAAAPSNSDGRDGYFEIHVVAGVYQEYVKIDTTKKFLKMVGDGIGKTIITGNRNGDDHWRTYDSGTFIVEGDGFVATSLTIRNTAGPEKHQAVALRNSANISAFYQCSFEGYQDTLYAHASVQFYRECDIYGTIDFIFGNAAVVFQSCNIYARRPMPNQFNAITAQGREHETQNTGTVIQYCNIKAAEDLGSMQTYLGRPWKTYAKVIFMETDMDGLINPAGWSVWDGDQNINTSYLVEYHNAGPGADVKNRVKWPSLHVIYNYVDALAYVVKNFIDGNSWLPRTGVPFNGGLFY